VVFFSHLRIGWFRGKERSQMLVDGLAGLYGKTWNQRVKIRIGLNLRHVEVQLLPPDQLCLTTLFHNSLEEARDPTSRP